MESESRSNYFSTRGSVEMGVLRVIALPVAGMSCQWKDREGHVRRSLSHLALNGPQCHLDWTSCLRGFLPLQRSASDRVRIFLFLSSLPPPPPRLPSLSLSLILSLPLPFRFLFFAFLSCLLFGIDILSLVPQAFPASSSTRLFPFCLSSLYPSLEYI